ncbi:hypothetical protein CJO94_06285 [Ralstonia solanacearum]|nr:hypothetical protein CJO94_06285 [Ralstonia solanacearum]
MHDPRHHTLLHAGPLSSVWPRWLVLAGVPNRRPAHAPTFEPFYLSIQAALMAWVSRWSDLPRWPEDLEAGRLVGLFPGLALPARSDYGCCPARNLDDDVARAFCAWLDAARMLRGPNVSGLAPARNGGNAA